VRSFVALEIDARLRARLGQLAEQLRPQLPGVKWVREDGIHLTLRFLGQSSEVQAEAMRAALARAAAACPACDASTTGLGLFPERGSPRVLWLGLEVPDSVRELQRACEAAAVAAGFAPEPRGFAAHLTLARWRERGPRPVLPAVELGVAALRELVIYRSDLRPGGAVYTPLARFPLGAA
jgi:2'-5' RNA ligase